MPDTSPGSDTRPGFLGRLPIGIKVPLAASALVLVMAALLAMVAVSAVRQALLDAALERQVQVAKQFAQIYSTASAFTRGQARATAERAPLAAFLDAPTTADRFAALDALEFRGPQDSAVLAVELRDASGQLLLATGRGARRMATLPVHDQWPRATPSDSGRAGVFGLVGDSVIYPVVASIGGEPTGYVVMWRRVVGSAQARKMIGELVGQSGTLLSGNADGSVWVDFPRAVEGPRLDSTMLDSVITYRRDGGTGGDRIGYPMRIAGTPWVLMVEFRKAIILAPAWNFARRVALIAVVCVVGALIAATLLSQRLTRPLQQLTAAAGALAAGDGPPRIGLNRADEIGQLGGAFDAMASQVIDARQTLERNVAERTRALAETLTQLEHAQAAAVRREKLASIGQLASSVGHELRNPLGVMSNAVYYLDVVLHESPETVKEYLGILRHQIGLSAKIINDLLDFSRISSADRQPVALRAIADAQITRLGHVAGVRVVTEIPPALPAVHVDPVHAGQVVFNLVSNAVQAMGENGGTLSIRACATADGFVRLEVADTGPGIAPEHHGQIFEPLFTTKARGIGLGLAVSRSLAHVNEGDLTFESEFGAGATFILTLPVAGRAG